ncbi:hypothetical protein L6R49_19205 [Myxococcota bacterium]|nr:hypothetical protein [Myxococcota bacterium]
MEGDVGFAVDGRYLGWPSLIDLPRWLEDPLMFGSTLHYDFTAIWLTPRQQRHTLSLLAALEMSHIHNNFNNPGLYDSALWSGGDLSLSRFDCIRITMLYSIDGIVGSLVRELKADDRFLFASEYGVDWVSRSESDRSQWMRIGRLYTAPRAIPVVRDELGTKGRSVFDATQPFGWNKELTLQYILNDVPAGGAYGIDP